MGAGNGDALPALRVRQTETTGRCTRANWAMSGRLRRSTVAVCGAIVPPARSFATAEPYVTRWLTCSLNGDNPPYQLTHSSLAQPAITLGASTRPRPPRPDPHREGPP